MDLAGVLRTLSVALVLGTFPAAAAGQDLRELLAVCGTGSDVQLAWCQETALGVQAAQGALGLAASSGADLPGSASTLGWRMKGSPRFSLSFRGSLTRAPLPAFRSSGGVPGGKIMTDLPALQVVGSAGIFDGFSLGPTVGGFLSLDLSASGHWVNAPSRDGFLQDARGWGVGGRVGVLRESFSFPGISVSAFYRSLGDLGLLDSEVDPGGSSFDLHLLSLRGVVGKDIGGIGFIAGAGWERYGGDFSFAVRVPPLPTIPVSGEMSSDRRLYFFGASLTFIALQLSGEVGWARGFDPRRPLPGEGAFDPQTGSKFGAVSLRLTF